MKLMTEAYKKKLISKWSPYLKKHPYMAGPVLCYLYAILSVYRGVLFLVHIRLRIATLLLVLGLGLGVFCQSDAAERIVSEKNTVTTPTTDSINGDETVTMLKESFDGGIEEAAEEMVSDNPEVQGDDVIHNYSSDKILEENESVTLEETEQKTDFHRDDWNLILVNKQHTIPEDYEFTLGTITGNLKCDERIIPELLDMLRAAKQDEISLLICSPYRDMSRQQMLFDKKISKYMKQGLSYMEAYQQASHTVTVPGTSEHQIGLALDIYTESYLALNAGFGETQAGMWLREHCGEYGFILRYPEGKEHITGIEYEPWHFRYVGKAAAEIIMGEGISLEEFLDRLWG